MSFSLENNELYQGTMSRAGKASAERFNILRQMNLLKEKQSLKNIAFEESDFYGDNSKEKQYILNSEIQKNDNRSPKVSGKLKLNLKKYFRGYVQKAMNKTLTIDKNQEMKQIKRQSKVLSLKDSNMNNISNLLMTNYNKFKLEKKSTKKKFLSPFYNKIKYKFHNIHLNKLKLEKDNKKKIKKESMYAPKVDYIYNKSFSGPDFKLASGRKDKLFEDSRNYMDKFYNSEFNIFYEIRNSFINMAKQTRRKSNVFSNDIRDRNESKFIPIDISRTSLYKQIRKNIIPKSPFSQDNLGLIKKKLSLKNIKNFSNFKLNKSITPSVIKCKSIPDFKRSLGRYHKNKHNVQKIAASNEGIYNPKYEAVLERPKILVFYENQNKKEHDKEKHFNYNQFKGLATSDIFNVTDAFEKYKLYKSKIAPKFEKMVSRPYDKYLPSFMQGLYNRMGSDAITGKSLKLNNYSNGVSYYDIYKNDTTMSKSIKNDNTSIIFDNNEEYKDYYFEESKVKENEAEEKTIKMKREINRIVSKMDKMYNNYINSKI